MSNSDWVSIGIIREAIRRLNRGYTALPDDVRKGWWRRLWLGLALVLGLTVAVVWGGKVLEGCGMLEWERGAVEWVVAALPISFSTAMWLEGVGNGFVLLRNSFDEELATIDLHEFKAEGFSSLLEIP